MEYPKVCLRRGEEAGVLKGQRLIYDNELDWADDICTDGCVVDVLDSRQRFAARGFFNSNSRLAVRVLTRDEAEPIDRAFFARRIEAAWRMRQALGFSDSCRVIFGESDGLPGLTVDKFADCLSFQIACLGLEQWKSELISILTELFAPRGIYERDDLPAVHVQVNVVQNDVRADSDRQVFNFQAARVFAAAGMGHIVNHPSASFIVLIFSRMAVK